MLRIVKKSSQVAEALGDCCTCLRVLQLAANGNQFCLRRSLWRQKFFLKATEHTSPSTNSDLQLATCYFSCALFLFSSSVFSPIFFFFIHRSGAWRSFQLDGVSLEGVLLLQLLLLLLPRPPAITLHKKMTNLSNETGHQKGRHLSWSAKYAKHSSCLRRRRRRRRLNHRKVRRVSDHRAQIRTWPHSNRT